MDGPATAISGVIDWLSAYVSVFGSHHWIMVFSVLLILVLFDFARRGYRPDWSAKSIAGVLTTFAIVLINLAFAPVAFLLIEPVQAAFEWSNIPHVDPSFWAASNPILLAVIAVIAYDFADYWNHRAMHHWLLWPIHAIHHSDEVVNGATALRIHVLEAVWMRISYIILLGWLGFPEEAAGIGAVLLLIHVFYVHIDLDWDHGPFKLLVASPVFHRWHHADVTDAHGTNLANIIPLWDYLFGTYCEPPRRKVPYGAAGIPHADPIRLMLHPFMAWGRAVYPAMRNTLIRVFPRR